VSKYTAPAVGFVGVKHAVFRDIIKGTFCNCQITALFTGLSLSQNLQRRKRGGLVNLKEAVVTS
jgi:hypothetical protein